MNHVIRSLRTNSPTVFLSPLQPCKASSVKIRQVTTFQSTRPDNSQNMESSQKEAKPIEETGDVMSHSFGDGYATRSDEEGFGGIYGGNQTLPKTEIDKEIHENHPAYDKSQGSEVKEKEKGRNQT